MSDPILFHPLANIFPLLEGDDFDGLVSDIKANGLEEMIVLHPDGTILDGRNRYRACVAAGVDARFEMYRGDDPLAFVISKNLKRRHLNESQRAMVAARLANMPAHRPSGNSANLQTSQADAAALVNVSTRSVASAAAVQEHGTPELQRAVEQGHLPVSAGAQAAKLEPETQRKVAAEAEAGRANVARTVIKQERRDDRESELAEKQRALPDKKFGVILADPEWRFEVYSRETGMDRSADNHYPTSATDAICQRDVASIAADDCVLFLWATAPMLPDALKVMAAWGFTYKSQMVWCKDRIGTGYWFRNAHEILLVGTRGNPPAPAMGTQWKSVQQSTPGTHSTKPDWQYGLIEEYFPTLPKIELNARRARAGWDAWGLEAPQNESQPEAQRDDTALTAAPAPKGDEPETSVMSSCSHGDGATDQPHDVLRSPQNLDEEKLDIPAFLRRDENNQIPEKVE